MKIGVSIDPRDPETMRECARHAEAAGIDAVVSGDSQALYREVFTTLMLFAEHTETPDIGVVATNPQTRHPTVTASAMATIDEASNGRALLGMATGDSAVKNTELEPASLRTVGECISTIQELYEEGTAEWRGGTSNLRWPEREVPIYMVGEGRHSLALGGYRADGVIHGGWLTEDQIEWARSRVQHGRDEAGRSDEVEFWTCAACEVAETEAAAIDNLRHILAAIAHIKSHGELDDVPQELVERFRKLGEEYRSDLHNVYDAPHNAELLDKYGLREYFRKNWTAAGPPDRIVERLKTLESYGVDGVMLMLRTPDPVQTLSGLREGEVAHQF